MKKQLLESILAAPGYLTAQLSKDENQQEGRKRDVVFYSGSKVNRYDWWTDEEYDLSFDMGGADLSELKARGKVLNGHMSYAAENVIGSVENPRKTDAGYTATLKFTEAEDIDPIWQRIEDGTLSDVSMGVKIGRLVLSEDDKKSKRKHYIAMEWTPYEISVVPFGADPGARFLSMDPRLERLRKTDISATTGAASNADESNQKARLALEIKQRRFRVLGR